MKGRELWLTIATVFTQRYSIAVPSGFQQAVKQAARPKHMTTSEYIRRVVLERLEKDGICIVPSQEATAA
jgi:hypothetical protein